VGRTRAPRLVVAAGGRGRRAVGRRAPGLSARFGPEGGPKRAENRKWVVTPARTLVVWCPDWPVVASGHTADDPVAVVAANRVVACSAAARADGVQRGQRRRQAEGRCLGLVVVGHDPGRDARAFEPVVAAVERCGPAAEILRPGVCAIPTRGPSRYHGGDDALVSLVRDTVRGAGGVDARVGVADGRFAAERAARLGRVIPEGRSAVFLASMPVSVLARPEWLELVDVLQRLGVARLGALAALPREAVLARFGADGHLAQRLAQGRDERPLSARVPPPDLVVSAELDPPAERVETAAFVARSLATQLHDELGTRGLVCTRVRIEAEVVTIGGWGRPDRTGWRGGLPPPPPATVHAEPLPADVVGRDGHVVGVTGGGLATGEPARIAIAGGAWVDVTAWAGPWPVDERWWDPPARRRRARWQVVTADGAAHMLAIAGGRWLVEATYD